MQELLNILEELEYRFKVLYNKQDADPLELHETKKRIDAIRILIINDLRRELKQALVA